MSLILIVLIVLIPSTLPVSPHHKFTTYKTMSHVDNSIIFHFILILLNVLTYLKTLSLSLHLLLTFFSVSSFLLFSFLILYLSRMWIDEVCQGVKIKWLLSVSSLSLFPPFPSLSSYYLNLLTMIQNAENTHVIFLISWHFFFFPLSIH